MKVVLSSMQALMPQLQSCKAQVMKCLKGVSLTMLRQTELQRELTHNVADKRADT